MLRKRPVKSALLGCFSLAAFLAAGCSSMSSNSLTGTQNSQTGQAFVIGTDAPAASVISFTVQVQSIDAVNSTTNTPVPLISSLSKVDFARFNGLQDLLDLSNVPVGTYDSIVITLGPSATIGYLDTSTAEPTIKTMDATVPTDPITITLPSALVINKSESMGLRIDFRLNKSLVLDSNGQITSTVNPTFAVKVVKPGDSGGHVDELIGGVISVDASNQQFVIQRPNGRQLTIAIGNHTSWDGNATLSDLNTNTIVQVSGTVDNAQSTINADEITILTQNKFFASGQITYVTPSSGAASSFDLYVRDFEPQASGATGLTLGQLATVDLSGSENYYIHWMDNPMTQFLFNAAALTPGQDVAIGGPVSGAADASAVTTKRVVLRPWGFVGTVVPGTITQTPGSFQMDVTGFGGVLVTTPVTVYLGGKTDYEEGMSSFNDLSGNIKVRVVGLLLKDATSGKLVLLARHIDGGDN